MVERITRKGELPVYQPQITREAAHMLWEMAHNWNVPMTVALTNIVRWTYVAEEAQREERQLEGVQTVEVDAKLYEQIHDQCVRTGICPTTLLNAIMEGYLRECEEIREQKAEVIFKAVRV